jgi:hypothetical protein
MTAVDAAAVLSRNRHAGTRLWWAGGQLVFGRPGHGDVLEIVLKASDAAELARTYLDAEKQFEPYRNFTAFAAPIPLASQ